MSAGMVQGQRDLELVSRTLETLIERSGRQVVLLDRPAGVTRPVSAELASDPRGLLPVFLVVTLGASATALGVIEGIAEATALVLLVAFEIALEPFDMAVSLEGEDVRGQSIEKEAIVANHHGATGEILDRLLKGT